ncbi:nucleoside hydrolase [Spirosoma utsteinense]|uniref:Pyrimidine-specific ribonucleoside hydrolase n=1 Tax=Spirosoma utsteinense TaxID=2585773 RepID=A0ABR6W0I0_9BACT|nr:nucleoside hydrolase [Spirosoma utsteinense]MBC3783741.1 pyrimidine-specific ribonucleoside hydrolase [Spirosoma utsteinense]MBC3790116.1 pyrimidine-specific ribonucleoside hydrolase [Spirosoma utsteinense]
MMSPTIAQHPIKPRRVWLDTDIMIGMKDETPREVDDAIALIMALDQPDKIELVGISTITYASYAYEVTRKLLTWYNKTGKVIPVYRGSDTANDAGTENEATRALANALRAEKMPILAIGPVTNIATVVKNHPELVSQIEEVVVCAGRTPGLPFKPGLETLSVGDYNFEMDPESFRILFDAGLNIVLSGYECSIYTFLGKTDVDFLNNTNESDKWLYDQLRPWQQFNEKLFGVDGFVPWDTTPLGYLTHPDYFRYYNDIPVRINVGPNDAGPGNKPYLEVSYDYTDTNWRATYAYKTLPGFEEIVIDSMKRASKSQ